MTSNATVIKYTPQPTYDDPEAGIKTVLLATDGTAAAEKALKLSIELVKKNNGHLIITYYASPQDKELFDGFPCRHNSEWRAYGRKVLERLEQQAHQAGVNCVETILEESPEKISLPELGAFLNADFITLASHKFLF